ncbi:hypothetical protein RirG_110590 [Rhizophagus irregularis DAOM 197198w]|nr:hypothetical protein RirG_110590 [Rhizophagus irregularis DAOM 197198w]
MTHEKLTWLQNQTKAQKEKKKNTDLSDKEGCNSVCTKLFPDNMWPKYEEYEKGLEEWLGERHPNYLQEVNYREWNNCFSGRHHSSLMQKVKDLRGFNVTVVKNAVSKN